MATLPAVATAIAVTLLPGADPETGSATFSPFSWMTIYGFVLVLGLAATVRRITLLGGLSAVAASAAVSAVVTWLLALRGDDSFQTIADTSIFCGIVLGSGVVLAAVIALGAGRSNNA